MGLSHTVSKLKGDFSAKSPIFPTRMYLMPPEGVPLAIGYHCLWNVPRAKDF